MEFKNLKEMMQNFSDDNKCRSLLENMRWNGKRVCPHCGVIDSSYQLKDGKTYMCKEKGCRKKFTVTVGTVFENSKIPLSTWFAAIYLCTAHKKGISSLQLSRDLGVTQKTAWFMLHRIREMMMDKAPSKLGNIVQVDETYVGGKNKNKHEHKKVKESQGRSLKDKTPVLGISGNGQVNVQVVPDTKAKTLKPIVEQMVKEGAITVTDEWHSYNALKENYNHIVVNHGQGEYVRGAFHTNTIEGFWSLLKRGIYGIYHQVSPKHLNRYCSEFAGRYNTREIGDGARFALSLKNSVGRIKYKELIAKHG